MKIKATSGSGTKISLHAGSALACSHIEFDIHVGTSGGAMIEPLHAIGKFDEIEYFGKNYKLKDYFDYEPFGLCGILYGTYRLLTLKPSYATINNFYKFYKNIYTSEDHLKLRKSDKKIYVGVNGIIKDKYVYEINVLEYEDAIKAIAASTSIPFFVAPVELNNDYLLDGGIQNHIETEFIINKYKSNISDLYSFYSRPDIDRISFNIDAKKDLRWYNILGYVYDKMQFNVSKDDEVLSDLLCEKYNIKHHKYFAPYKLTSSPYEFSKEKNIEFFNIGKSYILN